MPALSSAEGSARFDKFSEDARSVLTAAQEEALRFNQNNIGTEHLLLALVRPEGGPATEVLRNLGIDLERLLVAVRKNLVRGHRSVYGEIPFSPGAEKAIELAFDEARRLRHKDVGAQHLLVGLVREAEGIAARVLESMGVSLERVRAALVSPPRSARIIDGRAIAQEVRAEVARRARSLARRGVTPGLALILVGDNPSSISYVRSKGDAAEEAGIFSETFHLSDTISQEELTSRILDVDEDRRFHALLVQLPLPSHLDEATAVNAIDRAR